MAAANPANRREVVFTDNDVAEKATRGVVSQLSPDYASIFKATEERRP